MSTHDCASVPLVQHCGNAAAVMQCNVSDKQTSNGGRCPLKFALPSRVGLAAMLLRVFQAHHVVLQALLPALVVALIEGIDLA